MKFALPYVCAVALLLPSFTTLAQTKAAPASQERLLFAVNEGASGLQDASEVFLKYEEFMAYLTKSLGKKVLFHLARDFKSLDRGMKNGSYSLVMIRPANFAAKAVRDYNYNLVAVTKGGIAPHFIVRNDSGVKSLRDMRGARIALPEEGAYMTLIAAAMLREQGMDLRKDLQPSYHRDQAVIGHAVEMGMADIGVVASVSKIGKEWDKKSGRTALVGDLRIIAPVIAAPNMSADDVAKLRNALVGMEKTEEGKRMLKSIGSPGFEQRQPEELLTLLQWLEK